MPSIRTIARCSKRTATVSTSHVDELPLNEDGTTDLGALATAVASKEYAAVALQSPNFFGNVDTLSADALAAVSASETVPIAVVTEALSLAALATPASWGAQIVVGEAQSFGVAMAYGGPYVGFIASTKDHMRRIPGRLVGKSVDGQGRTAYVLTLQAREQHIRRERATSNICTNQAHCALIATIYLALMGKTGLRDVAVAQSRALARTRDRGLQARRRRPEVRRAVLQRVRRRRAPDRRATCWRSCRSARFSAASISGRWYPELSTCILMNATELTTTRARSPHSPPPSERSSVSTPTFDRTASPLIFELGQDGRANRYVEEGKPLEQFLPKDVLRDDLPLPDNSELDVVRHFTKLSQRTFGIDLGLLSARLVHDEVQPARQRRDGDASASSRSCIRTRRTSWRKARCR